MKYLIVSHEQTTARPMTIYGSRDDLKKAKELCEQLAVQHPGSTFSYYEWTGGYSSRTEILTERLWSMPEASPEDAPEIC